MSAQLIMGFVSEPPSPFSSVEIWRQIQGFECYEVSTLGRFRNARTGAFIKGTVAHNGYVHIGLVEGGRGRLQKWFLAHRLVAEAFLERTHQGEVVNHRNSIRTDNRACNLEWCTRSHNAKHWRLRVKESP